MSLVQFYGLISQKNEIKKQTNDIYSVEMRRLFISLYTVHIIITLLIVPLSLM